MSDATKKQRAGTGETSRQPRNQAGAHDEGGIQIWESSRIFQQMLKTADVTSPPEYRAYSRELDRWLYNFVKLEPHLNGVKLQAVALAKNRGFTLVGGVRSVNAVKSLLHNADRQEDAPHGDGWREFMASVADAYYTANIGAIVETARYPSGQLAGLWSTDPTRFALTNNSSLPIEYHPRAKSSLKQKWSHADFFRLVPNKQPLEEYRGLGVSAVYSCMEIAKIMVGLVRYDQEKLMAKLPLGILFMKGIDRSQWEQQVNEAKLLQRQMGEQYYGNVYILFGGSQYAADASSQAGELGAELVSLANLPDDFERDMAVANAMRLYALAFGHDVREFWGNDRTGALFQSGEGVREGRELATQKGDADLFLAMQEKLNREFRSVQFEFEERSDKGRMTQAETDQIFINAANMLSMPHGEDGEPLLVRAEVIRWLVERGVLDESFASGLDEITLDDEDSEARLRRARDAARTDPKVYESAQLTPSDALVKYNSRSGRMDVLYDRCDAVLRPHVWRGYRPTGSKQRPVKRATLWADEDDPLEITDADVQAAFDDMSERLGEFADELLNAPVVAYEG